MEIGLAKEVIQMIPTTKELLVKYGRRKYFRTGKSYSRSFKDAVSGNDKEAVYLIRRELLRLERWI